MKKIQDPEVISFIEKNLNKIPLKEIAIQTGVSKTFLRNLVKKKGWKMDHEASLRFRLAAMPKNKTSISPEHDRYIQENYLTIPVKTIAAHIGRSYTLVSTRLRQLGLAIPPDIIEMRKTLNQLKPGNIPKNKGKKLVDILTPDQIKRVEKTWFQKGHTPGNVLYNGAESIRKDKRGVPYLFVRVSKKIWIHKQIINYEAVHGPIPKGYLLRCKSNDTTNADLDNWELVSRKDHARKNSGSTELTDGCVLGHLVRQNPELKKTIRTEYPDLIEVKRQQLLLNRKIKNHEQNKNNRKN